ncbi:MAG: DUF6782 family putative metallopeptidase [Alphaproteobacteria bacterium]
MGLISEAMDEINGTIATVPWEEPEVPLKLYADSEQRKARLSHVINTIAKGSPLGKKLLEEAASAGYSLSMGYMNNVAGTCDAKEKRIVLNPSLPDSVLVSTLVHESRHAQQDQRANWTSKFGQHNFVSEVMLFRAIEADAQAAAAAACYEILQNTGNRGPYHSMYESDPLIVSAFSSKKTEQPGKVTPEMFQAAFNGWYKNSEMLEGYERSYFSGRMRHAIQTGDFSDTPYDRSLTSSQIVQAFCTDMDGECYWKNDPDVLADRNKLEICAETRKVAGKFYRIREEKTGKKADLSYSDMKVRDGEPAFSESFNQLKRAFSGEYLKNTVRDLKAEVDLPKEGSLLEKQRMNHLINEISKNKADKKNLEALKSAGYSLTMESLGRSVSARDDRNKVIILARRASDRELQEALTKTAQTVGRTFSALRLKQSALGR